MTPVNYRFFRLFHFLTLRAREHGIEGRITYPFHPRCGETVVILKRFAFRDIEVVAVPHPDGAIVWIPAWMMDASAAHYKLCKEPRFSIAYDLCARRSMRF